MKSGLTAVALLCILSSSAPAGTVLIEAEAFDNPGGWQLDHQSLDVMGSPYLLAHGLGVPVADATTTVRLPKPGRYRVFVRTKDWVARWGAPGTPGKFQLLVDGEPLAAAFGTQGAEWFWQDGGSVQIDNPAVALTLKDLTGFEGRCDAVILSDEPGFVPPNDRASLMALRHAQRGLPKAPNEKGEFDLVVVGGGMAGCCSAVSAARLGLSVALIQNRHVLGGNSSSEIRVWINGRYQLPPYPVIGEIVAEMYTRPHASPGRAEEFGDDLKMRVVTAEKNLTLLLGEHVDQVEMQGDRIAAVVSVNTRSGQRSRYTGRHFADCTGDGAVGLLAGADYAVTTRGHMGSSNLWSVADTGAAVQFPHCPWALDVSNEPFPIKLRELGVWFWESGFDMDTVRDAEAIRDHNLRAMYGVWDALKNAKGLYPNHKLAWAAYVSGRRESRRLMGDVVLTKDDVMSLRDFPDACVTTTWSIDLHYPDERYVAACPSDPFISKAVYTRFARPYAFPYRCLYSRNVANLFMAGRDISVTHEALGTVRVMATGGMMGEVVGRAATLCKRADCDPRDVYSEHLDELKALLRTPTRRKTPPAEQAATTPNAVD
jgi:hypothetical protein